MLVSAKQRARRSVLYFTLPLTAQIALQKSTSGRDQPGREGSTWAATIC